NINAHSVTKFDDEMFLVVPLLLDQFHSVEAADAVRQVDDQIPFIEFQKTVDGPAGGAHGSLTGDMPDMHPVEQFVVAQDDEFGENESVSLRYRPQAKANPIAQ